MLGVDLGKESGPETEGLRRAELMASGQMLRGQQETYTILGDRPFAGT
jgi:hypothetical protein